MNPFSGNEKAFELSKELSERVSNQNEFQSVWKQISHFIDKNYPEKGSRSEQYYKNKLREYEKLFVEFVVEIGKKRGTNETISAIIGYLLIYQYLTQSELKKLSGLSKGAISENLKKLVEIGFIKRKMTDNIRAYQYSLGNDMKAISQNTSFIKLIKGQEIEAFSNKKLSQLEQFDDQSKAGTNLLKERLEELKAFSNIYQTIIQQIKDSKLVKRLEADKN